jgi:Fur family ferric uptake transcriptional regulator
MYNTKQKDILLNLFKDNPDKCFSSREIIDNSSITLGEATVYRLLSQFVKNGKIKKFVAGKSGPLYQYNHCSGCAHFHMKCMECGELYHIDYPLLKAVEESIEKDYNFLVDNTNTTLYGYCKTCRKEA